MARSRWNRSTVILVIITALCLLALLIQRHFWNKKLSTTTPAAVKSHSQHLAVVSYNRKCYSFALRDKQLEKSLALETNPLQPSPKLVLMHSFPQWYQLKPDSNVFDSCDHPCHLSLDTDQASVADCVVFYTHYRYFPKHGPPDRCEKSVWVYLAVESPIHSNNEVFSQDAWRDQFNWTMTYRQDSDIYFGYGQFLKEPNYTPKMDLSSVVRGKTQMVAWFVSNCKTQSRREDFVAALQDFVTVDVYGHCGDLQCGRQGDQSCMDMLSRDYFFYLSFENSLCVDYVTEKLYRTMKMVDIIPIVRGGADYSALLPEGSYINVDDFASVEALAEYMKLLAGDESAYMGYLSWKLDWTVIEPMPLPFCEICDRLHNQRTRRNAYNDVHSWWHKDTCHNPPKITLS
ncbi:hypothetical protein BaRGS_00010987 [Batillaria attramentaria]|uniref:Fucosyltransferase n=1 Tax=Batillaria attramentaria TaxID=370345 RepID=A0ABD0LFF8_9CAEN